MYQPASSRSKLQDAVCRGLPVPAGWIGWTIKETLSPDVIEEQGALACAYSHYVLIKADWANSCSHVRYTQKLVTLKKTIKKRK